MNDVQHNDALAFSARVLGALFYFAPDSALAEPLVAAFRDGEWAAQWPYPVGNADALSAAFAAPCDESLAEAWQRLFIGPSALPSPPWGSVWLDRENVLFGDSTLALRQWMPELDLPDLSDAALLATLDDWLRPAFAGKTRLDAVSEEELGKALKSPLPWEQRQLIDRHAPARIAVPSGMERRIDYALDHEGAPQPPVLAVKLQELFGLADTLRIADGRVPLLLHLLSPGGKPLQVTADLRNFWDSTYAEVKKEMKGRYPRHPWPDDPWSATATHRAKPRGT